MVAEAVAHHLDRLEHRIDRDLEPRGCFGEQRVEPGEQPGGFGIARQVAALRAAQLGHHGVTGAAPHRGRFERACAGKRDDRRAFCRREGVGPIMVHCGHGCVLAETRPPRQRQRSSPAGPVPRLVSGAVVRRSGERWSGFYEPARPAIRGAYNVKANLYEKRRPRDARSVGRRRNRHDVMADAENEQARKALASCSAHGVVPLARVSGLSRQFGMKTCSRWNLQAGVGGWPGPDLDGLAGLVAASAPREDHHRAE